MNISNSIPIAIIQHCVLEVLHDNTRFFHHTLEMHGKTLFWSVPAGLSEIFVLFAAVFSTF